MWIVIRNDMRSGTRKNIWKYIMCILFTIIACAIFELRAENRLISRNIENAVPGIADYMLYMLGGMNRYIPSGRMDFELPYIWMSIQLIICSCIFTYPVRDIYMMGTDILMRYRSRTKWWLGKCIWAFSQVCIIYVCIFIGAVITALLYRNTSLQINTDIFRIVESVDIISNIAINPLMLLCPFIYSIAMAQVQVNLSILSNPVIALTVVIVNGVMSAYVMEPYLLGNVSMLYRSSLIIGGKGIEPYMGCAALIIIMVAAVICGTCYFRKYDILKR